MELVFEGKPIEAIKMVQSMTNKNNRRPILLSVLDVMLEIISKALRDKNNPGEFSSEYSSEISQLSEIVMIRNECVKDNITTLSAEMKSLVCSLFDSIEEFLLVNIYEKFSGKEFLLDDKDLSNIEYLLMYIMDTNKLKEVDR